MTFTPARRRNRLPMLRVLLAVGAVTCMAGAALAQPATPPVVAPLPPVTAAGDAAPAATRPQPALPGASAPAAVDPADRIVEVRIEGNHATETAKLPQLVTRAGQIFDPQAIEQDVRSLHRSRKFVDVKPKYVRIREGVVVIFQVVERPMLRHVKYVGNRQISTRVLRKKAEIDVGDAMDPYIVEEARRRIESHYHEKGYDAARVTTVEGSKPGDTGAVFLVDEGRNRKVAWTGFVGNTIASDARLLTQIKSKPGILWMIGGDVDRSVVDEDVDRLTAYYRSLGFFQARVGREIDVLHEGNKDWVHLTYVIHEGPRYTVRNVSFIGNAKFKTEFLERDLAMRSGQHFNQSKMEADLNKIRDVYGGRGFVFADVKADPRFLEQPGQLDLVYNVEEGQRYRVGQINVRIRGGTTDPHTRHSVVMNRLSLRPGDILDIRKLRDDERRLKSSGLFLADAAKGAGPKIVFTKPQGDGAQMARDPDRPGFRGQSPDSTDDSADDSVLNIEVDGDWQDTPARTESIAAPAVWRGQSPLPQSPPQQPYAQPAVPMQQAFQQPGFVPQGFVQQPLPQPGMPPQPQPGWAPAQAWGGAAAAVPGGQPLPPVYTVQQPVAPAFPGQPAAPAGFAGQQPLPVQPVAQFDPNQPPGFQPPALPDFGGSPLPVFPDGDRYVVLDVDAEETQTGRLMIGAGVNSNAGLVGNIVIDEQNFDILRLPRSWDDVKNGVAFRGAGQRFRLEASPGTQLQRYMATFQEPYLFDTRIGLSLSASYYTRAFFDWAESRTGGRVGLGYQFAFAPDLSVNAAFRGESIDVFNPRVPGVPEIQRMLGTNGLYGFSAGLIHDTRDSPFMPTQGHLATFEFEQVLGTFVYPRGILEGRQYFLLNERPDGSGRHVLSVGSVLGMSGPDTPAYDNFFAGGYNTLRGFTFRGASPRQAGSNGQLAVVGGPFQWLNTIEYMFPITADDTLRGVVFTDFGTVESNVSINDMRVAPGVGMRITLPAMGPAPIALDFAFPVAYAPYDSKQIFSFFVGFAR
jgi:outer membrane protein insertion porin family